MSSFRKAVDFNDILGREWDNPNVKRRLAGTSYGKYGSTRNGLASLKDDAIIKRHMRTEEENLGGDCVRFASVGPDGRPVPYATMNWHGKILTADSEGVFKLVDEDIVNKRVKEEEEKRKYIENIIEKASLSDDVCCLILGVATDDLVGVLGKGSDPTNRMVADLKNVDARPSMLECYDPTSAEYSRAIAKFKLVVQYFWPVIEKLTPESTAKENI